MRPRESLGLRVTDQCVCVCVCPPAPWGDTPTPKRGGDGQRHSPGVGRLFLVSNYRLLLPCQSLLYFSSDGEEGDGRKVYPRLATLATVEEEDVPNEERTS